ncbi:Beta-barrel assembly machine subunit BamE [Desulfovibrio gilichinskyi]|uniref:Beta-barrel assembly machine subunit BamE n=2 Tax=Desulfovibrio gilichinskyi TaxID=1519643 RepID=A0A1X7DJ84_9BACT|nr:Beta-barrel assembly machine subunit BamE [Desulfovibrio gilichinskyi]
MKLKAIFLLLLLGMSLSVSGCSVYMAANQPDGKEMSMIIEGQPRSVMLGEFGQPVSTVKRADGSVEYDVFSFVDGYSGGAKAGRALFHGVADVFTCGLWEVVGTPVESVADGNKMSYKILYNEHEEVQTIIPLSKDAQKYEKKRNNGLAGISNTSQSSIQKTAESKYRSPK